MYSLPREGREKKIQVRVQRKNYLLKILEQADRVHVLKGKAVEEMKAFQKLNSPSHHWLILFCESLGPALDTGLPAKCCNPSEAVKGHRAADPYLHSQDTSYAGIQNSGVTRSWLLTKR